MFQHLKTFVDAAAVASFIVVTKWKPDHSRFDI